MEATKIPDAEFKTTIISMLKNLMVKTNDVSDNSNKETVNFKKNTETIKNSQK